MSGWVGGWRERSVEMFYWKGFVENRSGVMKPFSVLDMIHVP